MQVSSKDRTMKSWFATFGQGHTVDGRPVHNYYVRIYTNNYWSARACMFENFGERWCGLYDAQNFDKTLYPGGELQLIRYIRKELI